jgi:hypothetical protein
MGKSEGKGQPGRYRRRYEDNIKMDIKGKGWSGVHWFFLWFRRGPSDDFFL